MLEVDVAIARGPDGVKGAFDVERGRGLGIFGRSGAGKTTLLETVAGFVTPQRGVVRLDGRTLTNVGNRAGRVQIEPWNREVGLVRQGADLFPHLDVRENVSYSTRASRLDVMLAMKMVEVEELASQRVQELSGGQAQRVAIARMLAARPQAILLDEPLVGLDESARRDLLGVIQTACREIPAVMVAHEFGDLARFSDKIAVMDEGRILQIGSPQELCARPRTRQVASLLGLREIQARGGWAAYFPDEVIVGAETDKGMVVQGSVASAVHLGRTDEIVVRCGEGAVEFHCAGLELVRGDEVTVTVPLTRLYASDGTHLRGAFR